MPLNFECPYCASCDSTLISNFHSTVLNAKISVYQCEQCLNLFDFPRDVKRSELQKRLTDLQQDADERTAVAVAANAMGILSNPELRATIAQIQQENLIAQLGLIRQQIATVNPANEELLEELERQEFDTQVKIIEVQKQEVERRLRELQEDAEEQTSIADVSDISVEIESESQVVVVIYGYDCLNNLIPVDSYWADPSIIRSPNLEPETPKSLDTFVAFTNKSIPHLLRLVFAVFQMILCFLLLALAFAF